MKIRSLAAAALLVAGLFGTQAQAAPVSADAALSAQAAPTSVEQVQYRGRYWGGYGWRGRGYGYAPYIGAGIIAGAIIADRAYLPRRGYYYDTYAYEGPYYYPADYRGDPRDICARHFKSFEWQSGYYTTYGGERRLCPYLR